MRAALRMNPLYRITKPVRLIELFGGIGTQAMVFRDLKQPFEHYRLIENNSASIASYNAIHGTSFEASDIRSVSAKDIPIVFTAISGANNAIGTAYNSNGKSILSYDASLSSPIYGNSIHNDPLSMTIRIWKRIA